MPYKDKIQQKTAQRLHYLNNKVKYKESSRKNRDARDLWFAGIKATKKCICGMQDHRCLDFHHRNPDEKEFEICEAVKSGLSQSRILIEIDKCDVICANCHARQHYKIKRLRHLWLVDFKKQLCCSNCRIDDYVVLVFHHLGKKTGRISNMASKSYSVARILEEIAQCEVLCHNCHRIKHDGNIWHDISGVSPLCQTSWN